MATQQKLTSGRAPDVFATDEWDLVASGLASCASLLAEIQGAGPDRDTEGRQALLDELAALTHE